MNICLVYKNRLRHRRALRGSKATITITMVICRGHVQTFKARAFTLSSLITLRGGRDIPIGVKGVPEF